MKRLLHNTLISMANNCIYRMLELSEDRRHLLPWGENSLPCKIIELKLSWYNAWVDVFKNLARKIKL